jgi:hypothetical protein
MSDLRYQGVRRALRPIINEKIRKIGVGVDGKQDKITKQMLKKLDEQ